MHYWCSYACGKCLDIVVTSGQQMKKHFLKCHGITDMHLKADSQGSTGDGGQLGTKPSKSHCSGESGSKSKKDKGDQHRDKEKGDKMHGSKESKTDGKVASQDELQGSPCWGSHHARSSTAGRSQEDAGKALHTHQSHKKSKKHSKSSHKKSCH